MTTDHILDDRFNPFILGGYTVPDYFCDRDDESKKMLSAIANGRHLTLLSQRRMGKTGLIDHVLHQVNANRKYAGFYIDLFPSENLEDLTSILADAVIGKVNPLREKIGTIINSFFSSIRPSVNFDDLGKPTFKFSFQKSGDAVHTLEAIFRYLSQSNKIIVLGFDEFQQVAKYRGQSAETHLRTYIQRTSNIRCIYSGSHTHLIESMFSDYNRPFYSSTDFLYLKPIDPKIYGIFIKKLFAKYKRSIEAGAIEAILDFSRGHTFFVQSVCNHAFASGVKSIKREHIEMMSSEILREREAVFYSYRNLLSAFQWELLVAIAKEGSVAQPKAKSFIGKYKLGSSSSVQRTLKSLEDKMLINNEIGEYQISDVFLSRFLERMLYSFGK